MPYLVTTLRVPAPDAPFGPITETSRAVATLEEARAAVWEAIVGGNEAMPFRTQAQDIPEAGGTIGPLPDGTVIEVQRTSYDALRIAPGVYLRGDALNAEIIDAYNARET